MDRATADVWPPRRGRALRAPTPPPSRPPSHPTQAWGMEGAASDGNRGLNRGRPHRYAPLPPPTAAPSPPFPQPLANRLPAPHHTRPPPPTLARSHTSHTPDGDESYTLLGKNRNPLGWVTFQSLPWVSFQALPPPDAHFAARFRSQDFYIPLEVNRLVVELRDNSGQPLPSASVELGFTVPRRKPVAVPQTADGDYVIEQLKMPGAGTVVRCTVTAQAPALSQPLKQDFLLKAAN
jgi:hypothetical protein